MYKPILTIGYTVDDFWNMTWADMVDVITVYREKTESAAKDSIANNYALASMIVSFLGCSLNGKQIPKLEMLLPNSFSATTNNDIENEIAYVKTLENFKAFAKDYNSRHSKTKG